MSEHGGRWLVLGRSGFVGSALVDHLCELAEAVCGLSAPRLAVDPRSDATSLAAVAAVHPAVAALSDAMTGIDRVVVAAGSATPDARWTAELVGANSLLPGVVAMAAQRAGVRRVIHLSSAAVQGRTSVLTESLSVHPFSPYSRSKALGEQVLRRIPDHPGTELIALRATSVQGRGRPTTASLQRLAGSRLASVAGDGCQPSAVSSIQALCEFIVAVGCWPGLVPSVVLQPWEGLSVADVLRAAGGRTPLHLPLWFCRATVGFGYGLSNAVGGRWAGQIRRAEAMWFGQRVQADWASEHAVTITPHARAVLEG